MDSEYGGPRLPSLGVVLLVILLSAGPAEAAEHRLILETDAGSATGRTSASPPAGFPAAGRSRPVDLTPGLAARALAVGDTLTLNLFDESYTARIDRTWTVLAGTTSLHARIDDYPLAEVLISTTDGRTLASVDIPEKDRRYLIQSEPQARQHYLLDLSGTQPDELPCGPILTPPPAVQRDAAPDAPQPESLNGPLDPATIDLLIVYTPAARNWANSSGGGIANVISQAMVRSQTAHGNSNTVVTLTLLQAIEVNYTESGNGSTDLNRLTNFDGQMDEIHTWRDAYGADMVCLFAYVNDVGGVAWLLNSTSGRPDLAFSLTRVQQAATGYTHGHEMGHNMGCGHHYAQNVQAGPGLFGYSSGERWVGTNNGRYCSVMTYESGTYFADGLSHSRVAHFSNPSINYQGVPTGHATQADNARTIRETKEVIAAYRVRNTRPDTPLLISPADGATGVNLTPSLVASSYSDPEGHPQGGSQWQVARDSLFTDVAWDSGESHPAATQTGVPSGPLSRNVVYHWRARYKDSRGLWSDWSASRTFRTNFMPGDFDEDGDVDQTDYGRFQACLVTTSVSQTHPACIPGLMNLDQVVDQFDAILFVGCMSGAGIPANPSCAD